MSNQPYIDDATSTRLDLICYRLKNAVTSVQIINWLNNFEKFEWPLALNVLENLNYFTIEDILKEYDIWLLKIVNSTPLKKRIFIHGLGDFGKSGSSMMYYLLKTPAYKNNKNRINILSHLKKVYNQGIRSGDTLVLLDDIIGSGGSLITYYNQNLRFQLTKDNLLISIKVLCVAYMLESVERLKTAIANFSIYGNGYKQAFAAIGSPFGYRPKMLLVRELSYKYGVKLFSIPDRRTKTNVVHPLGYNKSQSLIVFAHSVPNNTLPIIWSSKKNWYPIFARSAEMKISKSKEFTRESRHWLSIAYKLKLLSKPLDNKTIYNNHIDYSIISIIMLKKRRSSDPRICQILGVTISEYDDLTNDAKDKGLLDGNGELTQKGSNYYDAIRTRIRLALAKEPINPVYLPEERPYVPKKFLGKG